MALDQALDGVPAAQDVDRVPEDTPRDEETAGTPAGATELKLGVDAEPVPVAPKDASALSIETAPAVRGQQRSEEHESDLADLATVEELRAHAWALAHRLAERYGLGALVLETPGVGLGFTVVELPEASLIEGLDPELLGRVSLLWWHLVAAAELMVADQALTAVSSDTTLGHVLAARDADALFERVWTPDPGQVGDLLWRALPEPDWQDFIGLMATHRRLHAIAKSHGKSLWASSDHTRQAGG